MQRRSVTSHTTTNNSNIKVILSILGSRERRTVSARCHGRKGRSRAEQEGASQQEFHGGEFKQEMNYGIQGCMQSDGDREIGTLATSLSRHHRSCAIISLEKAPVL
jgi:hypothetical protein